MPKQQKPSKPSNKNPLRPIPGLALADNKEEFELMTKEFHEFLGKVGLTLEPSKCRAIIPQ